MKRTVKEVAHLAGISVRTLHYYDEIGLLRPSGVTLSGYRLYDDTAIERLMQILFFKELGFPLKEIQNILDDPSFDRRKALIQHKNLLLLERNRLDRLIQLAEDTLKGEFDMKKMKAFDISELKEARKQYEAEAQSHWGHTDAWKESVQKTSAYDTEDWQRLQQEMDEIFVRLGKGELQTSAQKKEAAAAWQAYITQNYYSCSKEILAGLGEMYLADERFSQFLDGRYGANTTQQLCEAIRLYCGEE